MDVSAKTETEDISFKTGSDGLDEKENEATGNEEKTITEKIASEDLPEKRSHKIGEGCSLFPIHTWLYFLYIMLSIVLAVFGTLLLLCGSWTNTGKFSQGGGGGPGLPRHGLGVPPTHLLDQWILLLAVRPLLCLRVSQPPLGLQALGQADLEPGQGGGRPGAGSGQGEGGDRAGPVRQDEPEAAGRVERVQQDTDGDS